MNNLDVKSNSSVVFNLPALKIKQMEKEGSAIYISRISAAELATRTRERFKIAEYKRVDSLKDEGYQRLPSIANIEKIKNFLLKQESDNPLLPTAILVSSREPLEYKEVENCMGTLKINTELFIVDGQTRFLAICSLMDDPQVNSRIKDYQLPLIILSNFKEYQETEQFYIINSRQKKVSTDLALRHMLALSAHTDTEGLVPDSQRWKNHASKIGDALTEGTRGCWKGRIGFADDSPNLAKTRFISNKSFVASLSPFFLGSKPYFVEEEEGVFIDMWSSVIRECWDIVAKYYPDATKDTKSYSLMKTVGAYPMHMLFAHVLSNSKSVRDGLYEIDRIIRKASYGNLGQKFWRHDQPPAVKARGEYAGAYSSHMGHKRLMQGLLAGNI